MGNERATNAAVIAKAATILSLVFIGAGLCFVVAVAPRSYLEQPLFLRSFEVILAGSMVISIVGCIPIVRAKRRRMLWILLGILVGFGPSLLFLLPDRLEPESASPIPGSSAGSVTSSVAVIAQPSGESCISQFSAWDPRSQGRGIAGLILIPAGTIPVAFHLTERPWMRVLLIVAGMVAALGAYSLDAMRITRFRRFSVHLRKVTAEVCEIGVVERGFPTWINIQYAFDGRVFRRRHAFGKRRVTPPQLGENVPLLIDVRNPERFWIAPKRDGVPPAGFQ